MTAYLHLFQLLARRIGVSLRSHQQLGNVQSFVDSRRLELGLETPADYVELLERESLDGEEFSRLIAVVTNPHTFFFRDLDQFTALRGLLLQRQRATRRPLHVWSAGCATGEEPYSIAMLCADLGVEARILATDICGEALELARKGHYRPWSMRHLPASYRQQYTEPRAGGGRVSPEILERVEFRFHNLVAGVLPRPATVRRMWDWILCRNVMMYFDRSVTRRVAWGFSKVLATDGWLFLSSTESLHGLETPLEVTPVGQSFAYRVADEPRRPRFAGQLEEPPVARRPAPDAGAPGPVVSAADAVVSAAAAGAAVGAAVSATSPASSSGAPGRLYRRAVELIDGGELDRARARLQELLAAHPDHVLARVTLGNLHLRRHAFDDAMSAYREAQLRSPLLPEVHYLQGVVYRKLNDLQRAVQALRRTLFLDPDFWCASFLLAGVHGRLGQPGQRLRNLEHTLSVLERDRVDNLFSSHTVLMGDLDLDRTEVLRLCRRYLAAASTPR